MNKNALAAIGAVLAASFSTAAEGHDRHWRGGGRDDHHNHHHHYDHSYRHAPRHHGHWVQPQPRYYAPPPVYYNNYGPSYHVRPYGYGYGVGVGVPLGDSGIYLHFNIR